LYVFEADHGIKVGITERSPAARLVDIRNQCAMPARCVFAVELPSSVEARDVERTAHTLLADDRTDGEWFQTHPIVAVDVVKKALRLTGVGRIHVQKAGCRQTVLRLVDAGAWREEQAA
jgi:hypothetical protein